MQNYRKTSHTTYDCKYHIVWITKYRKKVMSGVVAERVRELVRQICKENDVEIIKGHVSKDHVHLFVSIPPHLAISKLVQSLKGKSSYKLLGENKELSKQFWGRHLWARGYFVATSGNVTDEVIMEYIKNQDIKEGDDDFTVSDPL
ncbi:MAG: IS200/IS605 family transposase [Saprospiraceae bacterium]|jgi:putative transposase|nr:IS200/IS605 family transposase [Saprospiraceae bacterium]MBP6566331.1 IS200/IS605 family transposase [Saprospiraceae bacterium]